MTGAALRRYCLAKPGAMAEYPFGPGARVYKVAGKMFALIPDETGRQMLTDVFRTGALPTKWLRNGANGNGAH